MPEALSPVRTSDVKTKSTATFVSQHLETAGGSGIEMNSVIGYAGNVSNGFILHPDQQHIIYALGSTVVVSTIHALTSNRGPFKPVFLFGHSDKITSVAVSPNGRYIASGQRAASGQIADIILWDWATKKSTHHFSLHKASVTSLTFSCDETYLASLGNVESNFFAVWDLAKGSAVAASKVLPHHTTQISFFQKDSSRFLTAGSGPLRIWHFDSTAMKLSSTDCQSGQLKRVIKSLCISPDDHWAFCGTTTGDMLQYNLETALLAQFGPPNHKNNFSMGVTAIKVPSGRSDRLWVGSGDGVVASVDCKQLAILRQGQVKGSIVGLVELPNEALLLSTLEGSIFKIDFHGGQGVELRGEAISTAHSSPIHDIAFPDHCSELFASASETDVRVWNLSTRQELLRISVSKVNCRAVIFKHDGTSIVTGWDDGTIRGFGPESGRPQFTIHDAHKNGVTCLAITPVDNGECRLISGGFDGQVRVWRIGRDLQRLAMSMKEHKETVFRIHLRRNGKECVSASADGSCIVWDLERGVRSQVMFSPTVFLFCQYIPDESQIVTSGMDRKVSYWDVLDGTLLRELEVAQTDGIHGLQVTQGGNHFFAGSDRVIKCYRYDEGDVILVGRGHSTEITALRLSPDGKFLVSGSREGAIFIWKCPAVTLPGS